MIEIPRLSWSARRPAGRRTSPPSAGKDDDPVPVDGVDEPSVLTSVLTRPTSHASMHLVAELPTLPSRLQGGRARGARVAAWPHTPRRVARRAPSAQRPHKVTCSPTTARYGLLPNRIPYPHQAHRARARRRLERSLRCVPAACYRPPSRMVRNEACVDKPGLETSPFFAVRSQPDGPRRSSDTSPSHVVFPFSFFEKMGVILLLRKN
jgi:hypothetical protein